MSVEIDELFQKQAKLYIDGENFTLCVQYEVGLLAIGL